MIKANVLSHIIPVVFLFITALSVMQTHPSE
jgi:hypothetical protein